MRNIRRRRELARLARRLRVDRPAPRQELISEIVSRIQDSRRVSHPHATLRRVALAGVAVSVMLTVLATFGGVGLAASGISGAAASTAHAVGTLVKKDYSGDRKGSGGHSSNSGWNNNGHGHGECEDDNHRGASEEEYCKPRLTICHHGQQTLTLPIVAAILHLIFHHPNDYLGPCRQR